MLNVAQRREATHDELRIQADVGLIWQRTGLKRDTHDASFFATEIKYGDPTRYQFACRADLLAFFKDDEGFDQRTLWHTVLFDPELQIGAAEYTYEGTHRYHGVVLIKVSETGITHWHEYQHISPKANQDGGMALFDFKLFPTLSKTVLVPHGNWIGTKNAPTLNWWR